MAFRVVLIESEVQISLKLNHIVITKTIEDEIWIPISDISILVIDNLRTSLTIRMLSMLAEQNVGVVICDQKHLPIGFYGAYDTHSRSSKIISAQINQNPEFYDTLWTQIVYYKIQNQAKVLKRLNRSEAVQYKIIALSQEILPGDPTNREAYAARLYFNELIDTSFSRENDDFLINSGLNYGYSIIRSYLARLCVGYGLNTQIGIHHRSEYNRFNLVDDLIEPVRPIVDEYAYKLLEYEEYFTPEHRMKLVNIVNHKMIYKNKKMYIGNLLEDYVASVAAYILGTKKELEFPDQDEYLGAEDEV